MSNSVNQPIMVNKGKKFVVSAINFKCYYLRNKPKIVIMSTSLNKKNYQNKYYLHMKPLGLC